MSSKLLMIVPLAVGLAGCAVNPVTGSHDPGFGNRSHMRRRFRPSIRTRSTPRTALSPALRATSSLQQ